MNTKQIEEEIRQYKLYKIQTTEQKIKEYEAEYNRIKQHLIIWYTKNVSSSVLIWLFNLIGIVLFLIGVSFLFPEQWLTFLQDKGKIISEAEQNELMLTFPYMGYFVISLSAIFWVIVFFIRRNSDKRKTIYKLEMLLTEIIGDMQHNNTEEKKKYEYFVDSVAEIEMKKNLKNNHTH